MLVQKVLPLGDSKNYLQSQSSLEGLIFKIGLAMGMLRQKEYGLQFFDKVLYT